MSQLSLRSEISTTELNPLDQNPAAVYLAKLAPRSRRTQRQSLEAIASMFGAGVLEFSWAELRYQHTAAIRSRLAERYAPATANRMLSALRGTLKEAWRLGLMDAEAQARAADVQNIKSQTLPAGRSLSREEILAIMQTCLQDASPAGIRDAAMLVVLRAGLRRSEVVKLDVSDFDPATGGLTVRGKGRKDRLCYVSEKAIVHLTRWLEMRGHEPGALLLPILRSGQIQQRRMTDQAVLFILKKRGDQAGLAHFSPHDWRRTFVSDLLDAGADISTVQRLAGHASPLTTARYDRRGEDTKRKAANLLD